MPIKLMVTALLGHSPHGIICSKLFWVTLLTAVIATQPSLGQSFNCRHAHHRDERVICQDATLAKLDEYLASVYRRLILSLSKREGEQLDRDEEAFVITRRRCGSRRSCVEQSYRDRIQQLEQALQSRE